MRGRVGGIRERIREGDTKKKLCHWRSYMAVSEDEVRKENEQEV